MQKSCGTERKIYLEENERKCDEMFLDLLNKKLHLSVC